MKRRRQSVPQTIAEIALELRTLRRRTRSGRTAPNPWSDVSRELERRGHGTWGTLELADAVAGVALERHPDAPPTAAERAEVEASWQRGWAMEFPGEAWPGLEAAQRRIRDRLLALPSHGQERG